MKPETNKGWEATIYCGKETVKITGYPDFRSFVNKTKEEARQEERKRIIEWAEDNIDLGGDIAANNLISHIKS